MTIQCPKCSTPLTLTLAAETAKVERGWVVRSVPHGLFISPKPMWHNRIDDECVYSTPFKACETYRNHRGQILEVHRINGEWRLVDDKPEPAKVGEPEFDRYGRKIIKREGHAMIVETDKSPHDLRCCTISDLSGDLWFACDEPKWHKEHSPKTCVYLLGEAMENLSKAAATPLPIEKPAEEKVETEYDRIRQEYELYGSSCKQAHHHIVQMLDNLNARLAKVEGKNGV